MSALVIISALSWAKLNFLMLCLDVVQVPLYVDCISGSIREYTLAEYVKTCTGIKKPEEKLIVAVAGFLLIYKLCLSIRKDLHEGGRGKEQRHFHLLLQSS